MADRTREALPIGARFDDALIGRLESLCSDVSRNAAEIVSVLTAHETSSSFDPALAVVRRAARRQRPTGSPREDAPGEAWFRLLRLFFAPEESGWLVRALAKHPDSTVRYRAQTLLRTAQPLDAALPERDGTPGDWSRWTRGVEPGSIFRHESGPSVLRDAGLPALDTVGAVREHLGVRSSAQLGWLMAAQAGDSFPYHRFTIPKRTGGEREIAAPKAQLASVQRHILRTVLDRVPAHDAAHGFVKGRSTVTNAAPHVGQKLVVKFDLTDFFPTVHYFRALGLFASLGFPVGSGRFTTDDASHDVAPVLARLCTFEAHTPQGAPTSPAIANLVCRGLDGRLSGLATKLGGRYTRYADDLTFSFPDHPTRGLGRFRWWVDSVCQEEGFHVNHEKFRVIRSSQRQQVTGIVVNDVLRVPREARRRFRAILHNCRTHGIASQRRGRDDFEDYLRGFASYVHMVHPEEGRRLLAEVDALVGGRGEAS